MKKLRKIFHITSITILSLFILFFGSRAIYYKIDYKLKNKLPKILYKRILRQEKNYNLVSELIEEDGVYYFTGKAKNNYVNYKGLIWRIIKMDGKKITLILDSSISNLSYDYTYKWLNVSDSKNSGVFYNMLYDKSKSYYKETVDNFMHNNNLTCPKYENDRIYLLSEEDYEMTGGDKGFINNNTDFWIASQDKKYIDETGKITQEEVDYSHNVRPVIVIDGEMKSKGLGTIDDPYAEKKDEIEHLTEVENNEYLIFNDTLWRIISKENDKIKLVSEECIKDNEKKCINIPFSDDNNEINKYNRDSAIYYLNNTYYDTFKFKDYLTKGTFYIGKVDNNELYNIKDEEIELRVGMLSITDPHAFEINNTFLITGNTDSNLSIYTAQDNHAYETIITEKAFIRPVIYIKNNIKIVKGKGTFKSPYRLEGDYEEEDED